MTVRRIPNPCCVGGHGRGTRRNSGRGPSESPLERTYQATHPGQGRQPCWKSDRPGRPNPKLWRGPVLHRWPTFVLAARFQL